jgi:hypothetical protein
MLFFLPETFSVAVLDKYECLNVFLNYSGLLQSSVTFS